MHHFVAVVVATGAMGADALELFQTLAGESEHSCMKSSHMSCCAAGFGCPTAR